MSFLLYSEVDAKLFVCLLVCCLFVFVVVVFVVLFPVPICIRSLTEIL